MRIAVIGDIHGNLTALEAVLADCRARGAEGFLILGDLVMKGPHPNEVVAKVRQLPGLVIQGNTDELFCRGIAPEYRAKTENEQQLIDILNWGREQLVVEHFDYLTGLPPAAEEKVYAVRLLLSHGSPRSSTEKLLPETADCELGEILAGVEAEVVLAAHTHIPMVREFDRYLLVNSGSVGFPLDGDPRACYCLLDIEPEKALGAAAVTIVRVAYDIEKTIKDAENRGFPHARAYHLGLTTGGSSGLR